MLEKDIKTKLERAKIDLSKPSAEEFNHLRSLVGWRLMEAEATQTALSNSLVCCSARVNGDLVGFGRFIGDGVMYFYLQDVMIHPDFQSEGIGTRLMEELESWLAKQMRYGSTAGLLAAENKEGFYQQFNYQLRPGVNMGAGMSKTGP